MYGISLVCVTLFVWSGNPIYRTEPNLGTNTFVAYNQTGELHNIMMYLASITFNLTLINLTRVNRAHQVHTRCDRSTMFSMKCVAYQFLLNNLWMNFEISTKWPTQNAFLVVCETIEWESGTKSKSAIFAGTFPQKHIYYDTKILVDHTQSFLNCALLFNWTCVVILKILILASGFVSGVWYVPS